MIIDLVYALWSVFGTMAPYLIFGFAVAGGLSVLIPTDVVNRHLGGDGLWPIIKASLFGVPLPLCSCSVIPVSVSLRKHGASKAAMTSFLISTPQTGVDSIAVTYALLGPFLALFRPLAAFVTGIVGGLLVRLVEKNGKKKKDVETSKKCCAKHHENPIVHALYHAFIAIPRDIAVPLLVGVLIAATMTVLVPQNALAGYLGGGALSIFILMAAGVPVYVCATASVPIAIGFIHLGASPGAAVAFLIAGPATNAATFTTLWKILGGKAALIYLLTVASSAFICGMLIDMLSITLPAITSAAHADHGVLPWYYHLAAILLLALLGLSFLYKKSEDHEHHAL